MQIGPLDIPIQDFVLISVIVFFMGKWYVDRLVATSKCKALFISKDGLDGRYYPATDSIAQGKVEMQRPKGFNSKPEKVTVERFAPALNIYSGSKRDIVYKIVDGEGATSSWTTGGRIGIPSLIHSELAKAEAGISALGAVALKSTMTRLFDILLGFSMGGMVFMALRLFHVI